MSFFTCRAPKAKEFSFVRCVEQSSPMQFWMRRSIHFLCGLSGSGWYLGFIKYDKNETILPNRDE